MWIQKMSSQLFLFILLWDHWLSLIFLDSFFFLPWSHLQYKKKCACPPSNCFSFIAISYPIITTSLLSPPPSFTRFFFSLRLTLLDEYGWVNQWERKRVTYRDATYLEIYQRLSPRPMKIPAKASIALSSKCITASLNILKRLLDGSLIPSELTETYFLLTTTATPYKVWKNWRKYYCSHAETLICI